MIRLSMITWIVGAGLLGVVGVQQLTVHQLEKKNETLVASKAILQQSNAQHLLDLEFANLAIDESKRQRERERSIAAERERSQKVVNETINNQLESLRNKVKNNGKGSVCMRAKLPDYAIGLLSSADDNGNKAGGSADNASTTVAK